MTAAVSDQKICFVTDVEGNLEYFQRIVANSELIYYDKDGSLALKPNVIFVYGGDISDKGTGSIRFAFQLLALKKKYRDRVFIILGNRDINKMRWTSELDAKEMNRWASVEGPYWVKENIRVSPAQFLQKLYATLNPPEGSSPPITASTEALEKLNTRANRIKWMLDCTMGAQGDFERRAQELQIIKQSVGPVTDEEVVNSYLNSVSPGGVLREILLEGQLAYIHGETLFVHGGVTLENYGYVPFVKEKINDVHKWVKQLNEWGHSEVVKWVQHPCWADNRRGEFPPSRDKIDTHDWAARGGDRLMDYCVPTTYGSVVYSNMFDKNFNFTPVPSEIETFLNKGGIKRLAVGHQPHGFAPSIIKSGKLEVIDGDTSYSDMKAKDNRGESWSEIVIHGNKTSVHGEVIGKKKIQYTVSLNEREGDTFIGKMVKFKDGTTGWWVKGSYVDDPTEGKTYILSRVNGYVVEYAYYTYAQLVKTMREGGDNRLRLSISSEPGVFETMINGRSVLVTRSVNVAPSIEDCARMPAFEEWVAGLDKDMVVRRIELHAAHQLGPIIRFLQFKADIAVDSHNLPGVVFLRGNTVVVLVVLQDISTDKRYIVVERHPRAAIGKKSYFELPSGMDEGGSFLGVIRNLLEDEVGIDITTAELVNLNHTIYGEDKPIYLSPGASDEGARFFLVEYPITPAELSSIEALIAMHNGPKQYVHSSIIPLEKVLPTVCDAKTLLAISLYKLFKERQPPRRNSQKRS